MVPSWRAPGIWETLFVTYVLPHMYKNTSHTYRNVSNYPDTEVLPIYPGHPP